MSDTGGNLEPETTDPALDPALRAQQDAEADREAAEQAADEAETVSETTETAAASGSLDWGAQFDRENEALEARIPQPDPDRDRAAENPDAADESGVITNEAPPADEFTPSWEAYQASQANQANQSSILDQFDDVLPPSEQPDSEKHMRNGRPRLRTVPRDDDALKRQAYREGYQGERMYDPLDSENETRMSQSVPTQIQKTEDPGRYEHEKAVEEYGEPPMDSGEDEDEESAQSNEAGDSAKAADTVAASQAQSSAAEAEARHAGSMVPPEDADKGIKDEKRTQPEVGDEELPPEVDTQHKEKSDANGPSKKEENRSGEKENLTQQTAQAGQPIGAGGALVNRLANGVGAAARAPFEIARAAGKGGAVTGGYLAEKVGQGAKKSAVGSAQVAQWGWQKNREMRQKTARQRAERTMERAPSVKERIDRGLNLLSDTEYSRFAHRRRELQDMPKWSLEQAAEHDKITRQMMESAQTDEKVREGLGELKSAMRDGQRAVRDTQKHVKQGVMDTDEAESRIGKPLEDAFKHMQEKTGSMVDEQGQNIAEKARAALDAIKQALSNLGRLLGMGGGKERAGAAPAMG